MAFNATGHAGITSNAQSRISNHKAVHAESLVAVEAMAAVADGRLRIKLNAEQLLALNRG
jgi:hypothetical protein